MKIMLNTEICKAAEYFHPWNRPIHASKETDFKTNIMMINANNWLQSKFRFTLRYTFSFLKNATTNMVTCSLEFQPT